ncbi:sensor histidine kinase [Megalodesulfovibrio paquesii]
MNHTIQPDEVETLRRERDELARLLREEETARRALECSCAEQKQLYRSILDNLQGMVLECIGSDHQLLWVSKNIEEMVGQPCDELAGKACFRILQGLGAPCPTCSVEQALTTGEVQQCERQGPNGKTWAVRSVPIKNAAGCVEKVLHFGYDISELKAREEALARSEQAYRALFEQAPIGIYSVDLAGRYLSLNPRHAFMYGYDSPEDMMAAIRHTATQVFAEPGQRDELLEQVRRHGRVAGYECLVRRKDGSQFWTSRTVRAIHDEHGELSGYTGYVEDIQDRKRAESLRQDADLIMRHDLKSPLTSIIALPELMLQSPTLDAQEREMLQAIRSAGRRMMEMINSSLVLFQLERGEFRLDPEPVALVELVRQVERDLLDLLASRNITLLQRYSPSPGSLIVPGDPSLLYSCLANLIKNALEASPEGETVIVSGVSENQTVTLSIHNLGQVPERVADRFFEKYATAGKPGGTGLGTYSAAQAVHAHGGTITMDTSSAGTSVTLRLPATPRP